MSHGFPSELFPAVLPSHEESDPKWDPFCCWGSYGGVNVCGGGAGGDGEGGAESGFRPKLVAQLAHGTAAAGSEQRYAAGGPSAPLGAPGTCAWLSQWASRETLLASLRPARRWAWRRQDMVQRWIGAARVRDDVRRDLEDLHGELISGDEARAAAVAAAVASAPRRHRRDGAPPESARTRVSRLARSYTDMFDEVTVPKANHDVGDCLKCVRVGPGLAADGASDHHCGSAMVLASVDGAGHADLRIHSFDLGLVGGDYPHVRRLRSAIATQPTAVRQVDMRAYDDGGGGSCSSVWCAIRRAGGAVSVNDVVLAADGGGCEGVVQLAECSPAGAHSVSLNPHWKGEWLTASRDGQVALWSVRPEGGCAGSFVRRSGSEAGQLGRPVSGVAAGRPSQTHFGCHPRSAVLIEPTQVSLLDLRCAASKGLELFGVPSRLLHRHEYLVTAAQFDTRPFYHSVLADHTLLLLDERFPGHCLLCSAIPCSSAATYLDAVGFEDSLCSTSDAAVVIGCQEAQEAYCLTVSFGDPAPRLSSRPWRVGPLAEFLHLDAVCPRPPEMAIVGHRVSSAALMGVALGATQSYGVSHSGSRLAVFQLSSYGDIFVQSYTRQCASAYDSNSGRSNGPTVDESNVLVASPFTGVYPVVQNKVAIDVFTEWTKALISQANWVAETSREELRRIATLSEASASTVPLDGCHRVDSRSLLARLTNPHAVRAHVACCLCKDSGHVSFGDSRAGQQEGAEIGTATEDHFCYACSSTLSASANLQAAVAGDRVVPSDTNLDGFFASTSHFEARSFFDPNSQLHHKLWFGDDIEESLQARNEEWRVHREAQLAGAYDPNNASSEDEFSSDDDSHDSDVAATDNCTPCSASINVQRESRFRHDSISSSAGFLATPKRPRHQEDPEAGTPEAGESDEALEAVPLGFLSLSARATSPVRPSTTHLSQNRPKRQRLMQGF